MESSLKGGRTSSTPGVSRLQAIFRGWRSREVHTKRAKAQQKIVCPFVAANESVVKNLICLAKIISSDFVLDLGSGAGDILITIARETQARCVGYEIDEILCKTSTRIAKENNVIHLVDIVNGDALYADLSLYSVISVFLVPSCLEVLCPSFADHCVTGTRIVSYKFPFPEPWEVVKTIECDDIIKKGAKTQAYLYLVP